MPNLHLEIQDWSIREQDAVKKITGHYVIKAGGLEVARQEFNGAYNSDPKVPFSNSLLTEIQALEEKIKAEVSARFFGPEA